LASVGRAWVPSVGIAWVASVGIVWVQKPLFSKKTKKLEKKLGLISMVLEHHS
jgi:hypothetical protein